MQRVLLIPEVLRCIVDHQPTNSDRVALARTCRKFSEPALDALWSTLPSVIPLLRCLPDDTYGELITAEGPKAVYTLHRALLPNDWTRLMFYARRVFSLLGVCGTGVPLKKASGTTRAFQQISASLLHVLCVPPPGINFSEVFPRLKRVTWSMNDASMYNFFLKALFGLGLEHLHVKVDCLPCQCPEGLQELLGVAAMLAQQSRRMKSFIWEDHLQVGLGIPLSAREAQAEALSNAIATWAHLENLACCTSLNPSAFRSISQFRHLKILTLHVSSTDRLDEICKDSFQALKLLRLVAAPCESFTVITQFLQSMPPAIRLSVDGFQATASYASASSLSSLLSTMTQRLVPEQLRELQVYELGEDTPETWSLGAKDIRRLGSFIQLGALRIDTRRTIVVDDGDLLALTSKLPRLAFLALNQTRGWRMSRPGVTLTGLRTLMSHLPDMAYLMVAVDTQDPPRQFQAGMDSHVPHTAQSGRRPMFVDLLDSCLAAEDIEGVAAFLRGLFPELQGGVEPGSCFGLQAWNSPHFTNRMNAGPDESIYRARWKQVGELMGSGRRHR